MRITFKTYDVSCPFTIKDMMESASIVEKTLTMYDMEYYSYHSGRARDIDGDECYYINIDVKGNSNLDEDEIDGMEVILDKWRRRSKCWAELKM